MSDTPTVTSSTVHPIPVPSGVTHFKLRKGGLSGVECFATNANGITVAHHPVEMFDRDTITGNWGHDRDFRVIFYQETTPGKWKIMGAPKQFGIEAETAEAEISLGDAPSYPAAMIPAPMAYEAPRSSAVGDLSMLVALKDIARADSAMAIEGYRANAEASLQATREGYQQNMQIMGMFMSNMMSLARPPAPPATDPALAAVLGQLAQGQQEMMRFLRDEEEPDDRRDLPEEDDNAEMKAFLKRARRDGMGAVTEFVKEKGFEAFIHALPMLQAQLPHLITMLGSFMQAKFAEMSAPKPAAQAPPSSSMQMPPIVQPQIMAPPPVPPAPPAPAYEPPPDEYSPQVQ